MTRSHLLIDGDVVAFIAASAVQKTIEDENGLMTYWADPTEGEIAVERLLGDIYALRKDATRTIFLSDRWNWRFDVDPTYKANRKDSVRPLLLDKLKDYLRAKGAVSYEGLEADDAIGIFATAPSDEAGDDYERIIVGRDKDFASIPGTHFQLRNRNYLDERGKPVLKTISLEDADRWHMVQTLSGDLVDGYPGCPGIGPKRALAAVAECQRFVPHHGVVTRGPRKGQPTIKWVAEPASSVWECVVSHYVKAGLGEMEALTTARLARILRWGEYDFNTNEVTLWLPPSQIA